MAERTEEGRDLTKETQTKEGTRDDQALHPVEVPTEEGTPDTETREKETLTKEGTPNAPIPQNHPQKSNNQFPDVTKRTTMTTLTSSSTT